MATYAIVYAGLPMIEIFAYGIRMQEDLRTHIFDEVKLWFETFIIITAYKMLFSVHYSFICLTLLVTRTPFSMPFLTASPESRLATIGRETIRRSRSTKKRQQIQGEDSML
jgi:predicted transcriptional regulator